jgi:hypothetical protein
VRSKMRPPGCGSIVTAIRASPETEWLLGHHADVRVAQTANAWRAYI